MSIPPPAPGTLAVYSDIGCAWARLAVHRILRARARLGLDGRVTLEHRTFPLELVNRRPTPKPILDAEAAVLAGLDEDVDWRAWRAPVDTYPVTTVPALEAVQAVALVNVDAAEALDLALRDAMFQHGRCISIVPVIVEIAAGIAGLDVEALELALAAGTARSRVRLAPEGVQGSPHVVLPDGRDVFNPGLRVRVLASHIPVVEADDPSVFDELLVAAATPEGVSAARMRGA